jgi:putative ABC transport system ATP-binding protein
VVRLLPDFSAIDSEPETVCVASGSVLFEQGSMGDLIYVVVDGELEVVRESADGAKQLLKIASPGEYVGEIGPLFRMARSATVRARTDAVVTGYTVEAFHRLLETDAERSLIEHHEIDIDQENTEHDHRDLGDAALLTGHR